MFRGFPRELAIVAEQALYHAAALRVLFDGTNRAELDDILRIKIGELEPVLRDVRGREQIVLLILALERLQQVLPPQRGFLPGFDGPLDGEVLGALDNRGDD